MRSTANESSTSSTLQRFVLFMCRRFYSNIRSVFYFESQFFCEFYSIALRASDSFMCFQMYIVIFDQLVCDFGFRQISRTRTHCMLIVQTNRPSYITSSILFAVLSGAAHTERHYGPQYSRRARIHRCGSADLAPNVSAVCQTIFGADSETMLPLVRAVLHWSRRGAVVSSVPGSVARANWRRQDAV